MNTSRLLDILQQMKEESTNEIEIKTINKIIRILEKCL
jgi:hypothetical protein